MKYIYNVCAWYSSLTNSTFEYYENTFREKIRRWLSCKLRQHMWSLIPVKILPTRPYFSNPIFHHNQSITIYYYTSIMFVIHTLNVNNIYIYIYISICFMFTISCMYQNGISQVFINYWTKWFFFQKWPTVFLCFFLIHWNRVLSVSMDCPSILPTLYFIKKKESFKFSIVLFHKRFKKYQRPFPISKTVSYKILNYFYTAICIQCWQYLWTVHNFVQPKNCTRKTNKHMFLKKKLSKIKYVLLKKSVLY